MKPRRPTLGEAMTATTSTTVIDDSFGVAGDAAAEGSDIGRRGILVRVSPDLRSELKIAAIRRGGALCRPSCWRPSRRCWNSPIRLRRLKRHGKTG
jgi:hypothetical protein